MLAKSLKLNRQFACLTIATGIALLTCMQQSAQASPAPYKFEGTQRLLGDNGFANVGLVVNIGRPGDVFMVISKPGTAKASLVHSGIVIGANKKGKLVIRGPFDEHSPAMDLTVDQFKSTFLSHGERLEVWRRNDLVDRTIANNQTAETRNRLSR